MSSSSHSSKKEEFWKINKKITITSWNKFSTLLYRAWKEYNIILSMIHSYTNKMVCSIFLHVNGFEFEWQCEKKEGTSCLNDIAADNKNTYEIFCVQSDGDVVQRYYFYLLCFLGLRIAVSIRYIKLFKIHTLCSCYFIFIHFFNQDYVSSWVKIHLQVKKTGIHHFFDIEIIRDLKYCHFILVTSLSMFYCIMSKAI